ELFRERAVGFDQDAPLGELTVRWTGTESGDLDISAEFDESPAEREDGADHPIDDLPQEAAHD
ncbi:MAG: segregation/condensation protein A, partial [Propionibacteriaceae bacterium]|nr:segregation/condensation protein A [Propionibacteriaceae bacterium]